MRYRVYVGPRGTEAISPLQKDQFLFKEFTTLDDAFGWARHVNGSGRVTLLIDGDDGTSLEQAGDRRRAAAPGAMPDTRPDAEPSAALISLTCRSRNQGVRDMHQNIKEHMEVIGSDGTAIGTVDRVQGSEIKLTKGGGNGASFHPARLGRPRRQPCPSVEGGERREDAMARSRLTRSAGRCEKSPAHRPGFSRHAPIVRCTAIARQCRP